MSTNEEKLQVRLLGGFSAVYNGSEIIDSKHSVSQYASLMQLLLHFRDRGVSRSLMKEVLFEDRDVDDVQHAVRNIIYNAKTSRPSVCNAIETILVHKDIAQKALPAIKARLDEKNVELRCCEKAASILKGEKAASEDDWYTEYGDYILAVKVVDTIDEAIAHIAKYSTGHSESIITENYSAALKFTDEVDSAAVYVNASTRFTDGGEFGLGAEIGIATQKLHARGPMGLNELTSMKFIIRGNGQVR